MRVLFYSPMAEPDAHAASGVQRMGTLLTRALSLAGFDVDQPKLPRTYEGRGDGARQGALQVESERAAEALLAQVQAGSVPRPDGWFSYHVYYKSPDWIGPAVSRALSIPYLVAEGSHAPKRAGGPWALGHDGATAALRAAHRLFAMTVFDRFCLDRLAPGRVRNLKPFIDVAAFVGAHSASDTVRFVTVGTMKDERKLASYLLLADALRGLDVPYVLTIAGDGPHRAEIEERFAGLPVRFAGMVAPERIPAFLAAGDVFAWPGLGEAYGLVFLEAQGSGLGVVGCRDRGVPDAVREDTALLSAAGDVGAYAANLRRVATDAGLRRRLGDAGRAFVMQERSVEAAARTLRSVIAELRG